MLLAKMSGGWFEVVAIRNSHVGFQRPERQRHLAYSSAFPPGSTILEAWDFSSSNIRHPVIYYVTDKMRLWQSQCHDLLPGSQLRQCAFSF